VEEYVSLFAFDKTEALVRQLFNRTLRHFRSLLARNNG
jgi:hypothetical protein